MCKQIRHTYYCEELFLIKHKTKHSCESAIFYNLTADVVYSVCQFDYFYNTTVPRWLDPSLNRNIGKMSIPHCFDNLLGAKPRHPQVGELSAAPLPVDEIAQPSQIPGLNLTQFNNIGNFRPNVALHIPRPSTRACRAKNLFN